MNNIPQKFFHKSYNVCDFCKNVFSNFLNHNRICTKYCHAVILPRLSLLKILRSKFDTFQQTYACFFSFSNYYLFDKNILLKKSKLHIRNVCALLIGGQCFVLLSFIANQISRISHLCCVVTTQPKKVDNV